VLIATLLERAIGGDFEDAHRTAVGPGEETFDGVLAGPAAATRRR